jgi:hypothetical protein
MKLSKFVSAVAFALVAVGSQAQSIVVNGSFEANSQSNGTWAIYNNLTGWTGANNIELRNNVAGRAQDGVNYVELDTTANQSMFQDIVASAGTYELSFWYSAREQRAAGDSLLGFSFGSLSSPNLLQGVAGGSSGNNWLHYTAEVVLTGTTRLTFSALGTSNSYGGSLDNVSVTAVPEPETYALMLAGLGLIGVVARRRKAKLSV